MCNKTQLQLQQPSVIKTYPFASGHLGQYLLIIRGDNNFCRFAKLKCGAGYKEGFNTDGAYGLYASIQM